MANENFNYNNVKTKMDELQTIFDNFANDLNDLNIQLETKVDQNVMSAIFGKAGASVKKAWNENSASFSSFKANFEEWSQLVASVSLNNLTFEANAYRTVDGKDKITSSELLDNMGFAIVDVPSANGEETFETEQIDPYGDLGEFTGAHVAIDTSSVLNNRGVVQARSLVQPGELMTLTAGSKVVINGQEYIVDDFTRTGYDHGDYVMVLYSPSDNGRYMINADGTGDVRRVGVGRAPSRLSLFDHRFEYLVTCNPGWTITALAAPDDASYYEALISTEYVTRTSDVVNNNSDVTGNVLNNRSFVMGTGKMLVENDYLNSDIHSSVFYNPSVDFMNGNSTSNTDGGRYYIDSDNDGFITIHDTLNTSSDANNIERAFEKVQERGKNEKNVAWEDWDILDVLDIPHSGGGGKF